MTLYEMTAAAANLYDLLADGEIDEDIVNDTLEAMSIDDKLENYCKVIREFEADAEKYKAEKERLASKQKTAENAVKRMKAAIIDYMHITNADKATAGTFNIKLSASKAVTITDESKIPARFLVEQAPKIDKAGIRSELMAGADIDGAALQINEGVQIK